jgi:uncharacterized protein DUF6082
VDTVGDGTRMGELMTDDAGEARPVTGRVVLIIGATLVLFLVIVVLLAALGVTLAGLVGRTAVVSSWSRLSDIGQAFGVLDSVLSGLAFVALIATLWIQFRELRLQQTELRQQRDAIERSNDELRRSAEANMRMLHFELVRMSIDDADLAGVWPHPARVGDDITARRRFSYANLIYQHLALSMRMAGESDDAVRKQLRYLFRSEAMREYWRATVEERAAMLDPGGDEQRIARLSDQVCVELDGASSGPGREPDEGPHP